MALKFNTEAEAEAFAKQAGLSKVATQKFLAAYRASGGHGAPAPDNRPTPRM